MFLKIRDQNQCKKVYTVLVYFFGLTTTGSGSDPSVMRIWILKSRTNADPADPGPEHTVHLQIQPFQPLVWYPGTVLIATQKYTEKTSSASKLLS